MDYYWMPDIERSFEELKNRFTTAPILTHFDLSKKCIIGTDPSDFALGAILFLKDHQGMLHPIAFHSQPFQSAEIN
jgi:hypothetical protein